MTFVARGPFRIEEAKKNEDNWQLHQALESLALGPLDDSAHEQRRELVGVSVALVVEGARGFRAPKDLGMMPYDGCHIVVFQKKLGARADALFRKLKNEGAKELVIAKHHGLKLDARQEDDSWTYYFVLAQPNILLWATDEAYLGEVLRRMAHKGDKRALPASLPECQHVDTTARFWAVRHFDKGNAANDPSSPLRPDRAGCNQPDLEQGRSKPVHWHSSVGGRGCLGLCGSWLVLGATLLWKDSPGPGENDKAQAEFSPRHGRAP